VEGVNFKNNAELLTRALCTGIGMLMIEQTNDKDSMRRRYSRDSVKAIPDERGSTGGLSERIHRRLSSYILVLLKPEGKSRWR